MPFVVKLNGFGVVYRPTTKSFGRHCEAYRTPEILLTTFSVASY